MPLINDDAALRDILTQVHRIAVIGLSDKPDRPSHDVARQLLSFGYDIVPVNPKIAEIFGRGAVGELADISGAIDLVDVFRRPEHVPEIVDACINNDVPNLWLQEGVIHQQAAQRAADHGIRVVMDRCIFKEYNRLFSQDQT